jgi:DamX protein
MSTIERTNKTRSERESATTISANARIDYILRFSKHAVLVIDDDTETYTNVGNEFLGSLSADHNAAFVPISSKLNDIQVRCRIIEQLFGNTLFDPEQPLSVNVVKLAEAKNEAITIVISNVEFLSLQLSHELCQLAEIAKKLNRTINVILLGKVEAAKKLSENKHLFENKLSILLAENGQLINWNSSVLKENRSNTLVRNIIIFSVIAIVILITLFSVGYFNSNGISNEDSINNPIANISNEYEKVFVQTNTDINEIASLPENAPIKAVTATSVEIFKSLTTKELLEQELLENKAVNESKIEDNNAVTEKPKTLSSDKILTEESEANNQNNEGYYQSFTDGYVIQLGSFGRLEGYKSFLNTYKSYSLHGYTKEINEIASYVVTTQVYSNSFQAKIAIKDLSNELRSRGPWIKSVKAVNNEINLYKQSQ